MMVFVFELNNFDGWDTIFEPDELALHSSASGCGKAVDEVIYEKINPVGLWILPSFINLRV